MRISFLKSAAIAAATTLAGTGIALGTATSAQAATQGVDITAVSGTAVADSSTVYAKFSMRYTVASGVRSFYLDSADIYRGSTKVGTASIFQYNSTTMAASFPNTVGRGTFTLRNIKYSCYMTDYSDCPETPDPSTAGSIRVLSLSKGKLAHGTSALRIVYRGKVHHFHIGLRYYSATGWKNWKHKKVKILVKKHGHWKTFKKVKLNKKGKANFTRRVPKKYLYRILAPGTSTIATYRGQMPFKL